MKLFESLPDEEKINFIKERLNVGRFLSLNCKFTDHPKNKFLLLLAKEPKPLFFFVNSEVTPFIQKREILWESQIAIYPEDYEFLKYPSFLSCHEVVDEFTLDNIIKQILNDGDRIKELINAETRKKVIEAVQKVPTLTQQEKKIILSSLLQQE